MWRKVTCFLFLSVAFVVVVLNFLHAHQQSELDASNDLGIGPRVRGDGGSGLDGTVKYPGHSDNKAGAPCEPRIVEKIVIKEVVKSVPATSSSPEHLPDLPTCSDPEWCNIQPPTESYYRFDGDASSYCPYRWKEAQLLAASGEHVLLGKILEVIDTPFDFLDGDRSFRAFHKVVDIFVDEVYFVSLSSCITVFISKTEPSTNLDQFASCLSN
jgi:hypothetical protein